MCLDLIVLKLYSNSSIFSECDSPFPNDKMSAFQSDGLKGATSPRKSTEGDEETKVQVSPHILTCEILTNFYWTIKS